MSQSELIGLMHKKPEDFIFIEICRNHHNYSQMSLLLLTALVSIFTWLVKDRVHIGPLWREELLI